MQINIVFILIMSGCSLEDLMSTDCILTLLTKTNTCANNLNPDLTACLIWIASPDLHCLSFSYF